MNNFIRPEKPVKIGKLRQMVAREKGQYQNDNTPDNNIPEVSQKIHLAG